MVSDQPRRTFKPFNLGNVDGIAERILGRGTPVRMTLTQWEPPAFLFVAALGGDGRWYVIKLATADGSLLQTITLDDKRCTEECAHGVAEALNRIYASASCPYDTDGDGNCGRLHCPYCGRA